MLYVYTYVPSIVNTCNIGSTVLKCEMTFDAYTSQSEVALPGFLILLINL